LLRQDPQPTRYLGVVLALIRDRQEDLRDDHLPPRGRVKNRPLITQLQDVEELIATIRFPGECWAMIDPTAPDF
jgi:hypothetical protein